MLAEEHEAAAGDPGKQEPHASVHLLRLTLLAGEHETAAGGPGKQEPSASVHKP